MHLTGPAATARLAREKALALHSLSFDPGRCSLTLEADGTRVDDEEHSADTGLPELDAVLGKSRPLVVRPGCRRYNLHFDAVITHAVHDEGFHVPEAHEDFSTPLRCYTQSRFLTYLTEECFADMVIDAGMSHHRLVTLDQVIAVACTDAPAVTSRVLTASDLWLDDI